MDKNNIVKEYYVLLEEGVLIDTYHNASPDEYKLAVADAKRFSKLFPSFRYDIAVEQVVRTVVAGPFRSVNHE